MATKTKKKRNKLLKPVSKVFFIDECDGKETFSEHADKFGFVALILKEENTNRKIRHTKKTPVRVWELKKDASFKQMLESFLSDRRKMPTLFLTEHQLLSFLLNHRRRQLEKGTITFIPLRLGVKRFVAFVYMYSDGSLLVYVYRFVHSHVWSAEYRCRLVVPQLA